MNLLPGCIPTYIDRTKVYTIQESSSSGDVIRVKDLFVLASGNLSSRVISNNLYSALKSRMEQNNSCADFEFISKLHDTQKFDISAIKSNSYDGYMLLYPKKEKTINQHTEKFVFAAPVGSNRGVTGSAFGNSYEGIFCVKLFDYNKELIYSAEIELHFDPTKDALYNGVTSKLINELSKSNIQLW